PILAMAYPTNLQQWPVFPESLGPSYTTSDPNEHDYLAPQVEVSYTHGGLPVYVIPQLFQTQQNLLAFKSPYEESVFSFSLLDVAWIRGSSICYATVVQRRSDRCISSKRPTVPPPHRLPVPCSPPLPPTVKGLFPSLKCG